MSGGGPTMKSVAVQIIDTSQTTVDPKQIGVISVYCDWRTAVQDIVDRVELEVRRDFRWEYDVEVVMVFETPVRCNQSDGTLNLWKANRKFGKPITAMRPTDIFDIDTPDGLPMSRVSRAHEIAPRVWDTIIPDKWGDTLPQPLPFYGQQEDMMVHVRALVKKGKKIAIQIVDTVSQMQHGTTIVLTGRHGAIESIFSEVKRYYESNIYFDFQCTVHSVQVFQSPIQINTMERVMDESPPAEEFITEDYNYADPNKQGASISPSLWGEIRSSKAFRPDIADDAGAVWVRAFVTVEPANQQVAQPWNNGLPRRLTAAFSDT